MPCTTPADSQAAASRAPNCTPRPCPPPPTFAMQSKSPRWIRHGRPGAEVKTLIGNGNVRVGAAGRHVFRCIAGHAWSAVLHWRFVLQFCFWVFCVLEWPLAPAFPPCRAVCRLARGAPALLFVLFSPCLTPLTPNATATTAAKIGVLGNRTPAIARSLLFRFSIST